MPTSRPFLVAVFSFLLAISAFAQKERARDLGVPFDGVPGSFNAITDVKGVEVGHTTLISGEGECKGSPILRISAPRQPKDCSRTFHGGGRFSKECLADGSSSLI